jgi:hypothetical protein
MSHLALVILLISQCLTSGNGANILFFFAISTYSHRISVWPLVEALAERGHNVSFFSSHSPKTPNPKVTEVTPLVLQTGGTFQSSINFLDFRFQGLHPYLWNTLPYSGIELCEKMMGDPEILDWIHTSSFDLIIMDNMFNDCVLGLSYKFRAPHILFATSTLYMWQNDLHGFLPETSWIPDAQFHYPEDMSFIQRVTNTLRPIGWHLFRKYYFQLKLESLLREGLNIPEMPSLRQIEMNTSLVLISTHYSEEYGRSVPPLVVSVGGMHVSNVTKPLPAVSIKYLTVLVWEKLSQFLPKFWIPNLHFYDFVWNLKGIFIKNASLRFFYLRHKMRKLIYLLKNLMVVVEKFVILAIFDPIERFPQFPEYNFQTRDLNIEAHWKLELGVLICHVLTGYGEVYSGRNRRFYVRESWKLLRFSTYE